jgi:hypothetical protein
MKRFIFVARDIMSARIMLAVIKSLRATGHAVFVIAEGKALDVFQKNGITPYFYGSDTLTPLGINGVVRFIKTLNPHAICVGTSIPINWEKEFADAGFELGIPVVAFADTWGALERLKGAIPDIAFVIDTAEARHVVGRKLAKRAEVIGDIASEENVQISSMQREALDKICGDKTSIMLVGDHLDNVEEIVSTAVQSIRLEKNPQGFMLFGSFVHPKLAKEAKVKYVLGRITEMLDGLPFYAGHRELDLNTDQMAGYSDITVTSFATPGRYAIFNGNLFMSVAGPCSTELMRRECGFDVYPLVSGVVIPVLTGKTPISEVWNDTYEYKV